MTPRDALRQRIMDALDSSEARCPRFYDQSGDLGGPFCDGLDGCEGCLRLAADAVLRVVADKLSDSPDATAWDEAWRAADWPPDGVPPSSRIRTFMAAYFRALAAPSLIILAALAGGCTSERPAERYCVYSGQWLPTGYEGMIRWDTVESCWEPPK